MKYLFIIAILPAILLIIYVCKMAKCPDKGFIGELVVMGIIMTIPAILLEQMASYSAEALFSFDTASLRYKIIHSFCGIAFVEELCKWLILNIKTKNCTCYTRPVFGILFAVCVSLGFAIPENLFYCINEGFDTAIFRAFTSVPSHLFFGVIMGVGNYMSLIRKAAKDSEKSFVKNGLIIFKKPHIEDSAPNITYFFLAVITHGLYDFLLCLDGKLYTFIFCIFLAILYVSCFGKVISMSKLQKTITECAYDILYKKYPDLPDAIEQRKAKTQEARTRAVANKISVDRK